MATSAGTAFVEVQPSLSSFQSKLASYFGGSSFGKYGKVAGAGFATAFAAVGAGKVLYDIGKQFDDAFDTIATKTGATGKALGKMEDQFKSVVSSVPTDFGTAADAVGGLNQRLDESAKPLTALATQLTALSKITGEDINTEVQTITRLFGDWSVATKDQTETLDELFRLTQETGISMTDLSELMVQFGSPLRQLGFHFNEAAAMFARFEREGVNMQTLLPGLRMALKNIALPSDELAAKFKELGVSTKDPHDALLQIFDLLSKDKISEADQTFLASGVFGGRAWADMKAAIEEGRFEFDDLISTMKGGDATIRGTERSTRDFAEWVQILGNRIKVFLEPVATTVFKAIGDELRTIVHILGDKNLTSSEKFKAILDEVSRVLGDLTEMVAKAAPDIAATFVTAFLGAPIWTQLLVGGLLLKKLMPSVEQAAKTGGSRMGGMFGNAFMVAGGIGILEAFTQPGGINDTIEGQAIDQTIFADVVDPLIAHLKKMYGSLRRAGLLLTDEQRAQTEAQIRLLVETGNMSEKQGDRIIATLEGQGKAYRAEERIAKDAQDGIVKALGRSERAVSDLGQAVAQGGQKFQKDFAKSTGKLEKTTEDDFMAMAAGAGVALGQLSKYTNDALTALGVNKVDFGVQTVGMGAGAGAHAGGGQNHARGAFIQGGAPIGDSVPAMLERGEGVLNRNATAALGGKRFVDWANRRFARFQKGGFLGKVIEALGPVDMAPFVYDAHHAGANRHLHLAMQTPAEIVAFGRQLVGAGYMVSENPAFGGVHPVHAPNSYHYSGQAIDINTAEDETIPQIRKVVQMLGGAAAGAIAEQIKRVMLTGPKGALRSTGQGALDKVRKAANAFIAKQAPTGGFDTAGGAVGSFKGINSAAEFIPFWNRVTGLPAYASAFSKIVPAESGWDPHAGGPGTSNPTHAGWYQFDAPTWSDFGSGPWLAGAYNPGMATIAAGNVARREGQAGVMSRWAQTFGGFLHGGIVPGVGPKMAMVHGGERISPPGTPAIELYINADGVNIDDVYAVVDGHTVEVMRQGGKNVSRARQLAGRAGRI